MFLNFTTLYSNQTWYSSRRSDLPRKLYATTGGSARFHGVLWRSDRNRKEETSGNASLLSLSLSKVFGRTDIFRLHEQQNSHSRKSSHGTRRLFDSQALDLILFRVYFPSSRLSVGTRRVLSRVSFGILPKRRITTRKGLSVLNPDIKFFSLSTIKR